MGMFDHVTIDDSITLPVEGKVHRLQTKNLGCDLKLYHITHFGRLINTDTNVDLNYDGTLSVIGREKTRHNLIMMNLVFENGFLASLTGTKYDEKTSGIIELETIKFELPLWRKLWRVVLVLKWELKMIFFPPERNVQFVIPEKNEMITIPF